MKKKTLLEIHHEHDRYVSDKWELYLNEYENIFQSFRDKNIGLLEIGVQNGGSLEVWSKYFENAKIILGCDIDSKCRSLKFKKEVIKVIIGDATDKEIINKILEHIKIPEIIIDDGSHISDDVIKTFLNLFPILADNGVYVIEDMHCSYWQEYSGGLYKPNSSVGFFKSLCDIVNYEHWGTSVSRKDFLSEILIDYGNSISECELSRIHSIRFINSMCIVEKKSNIKNQLNREIVSGNIEIVTPGRLLLHNESLKPLDQLQNPWNKRKYTEDQKSSEIEGVNQESKQLLNAKDVIAEKKLEIERIKQESNELLNAKDYKINSLKKQIKELQEARSWKIIRHLREACVYFNIKKTHAKKLLKKIIYLAKSIDVLILEIYKNLEELGRGSRNADHTIFSNCNDSVSVVYIARNTSDADIDSIDRFIYSYNQYKTNKQHGLHVILKGSGSNYSREDIIRKFDFYCKIHELPDDGYDIGAYIRIAGKIDDQIIIFLNSHSTICCDKWIEKLVNPFIDNKIGLVGCTASFESLSPLGIEFPRTPNPHIRTNGFAIRKKDFAYITKNVVISSKYDAWIFESGFFSLTKRIMNLDKNYIIVDKKGVTYGVESFQIAGTFRNLYRSNQIISDNQHKEYSKYNILNKIRVTLNTWSKCTKNW